MSLPAFLVSFAGIVLVHELIHVAVHPMSGRSPHSIVGVGGPLLWGLRPLRRRDDTQPLCAILLMPLVVISFVPCLWLLLRR